MCRLDYAHSAWHHFLQNKLLLSFLVFFPSCFIPSRTLHILPNFYFLLVWSCLPHAAIWDRTCTFGWMGSVSLPYSELKASRRELAFTVFEQYQFDSLFTAAFKGEAWNHYKLVELLDARILSLEQMVRATSLTFIWKLS